MSFKRIFLYWMAALLIGQLTACSLLRGGEAALMPYTVVQEYPHNVEAYTQGLVMHEGRLYEGTGIKKQSWLAEIEIETGREHRKVVLDDAYFGEGITILNGRVYQLSWKSRKGFIYNLSTFEPMGEFSYRFSGWGLTHNGAQLIASDGSDKLYYLDSISVEECGRIAIREKGRKARQLNELEYIGGYIFANQWKTDFVLIIDPAEGKVVAKLDLAPLAAEIKKIHPGAGELNGIAWNSSSRELLITGKYWPKLYAIRIEKGEDSQAISREIIRRIYNNN